MKVWVTTSALSTGITVHEVEDTSRNTIAIRREGQARYELVRGEGQDWHRTRDSALLRAEQMRRARIEWLLRQAERLTTLEFAAPP